MRRACSSYLFATLAVVVAWHQLATAAIPTAERDALVALYNATGGDGWHDNSGWLGNAGSECSWSGIWCDDAAWTE